MKSVHKFKKLTSHRLRRILNAEYVKSVLTIALKAIKAFKNATDSTDSTD